jgi:hypothetical protein
LVAKLDHASVGTMFCNTGIDWAATGTWAQFFAGIMAVFAAVIIARSQLVAQRKVAREERAEFAVLVLETCEKATETIVKAAKELATPGFLEALAYGDAIMPTTEAYVGLFKKLDFNRMPSARAALGVGELRRLCGWTVRFYEATQESWKRHGAVSPDLDTALGEWSDKATAALEDVRAGLGPQQKGRAGSEPWRPRSCQW